MPQPVPMRLLRVYVSESHRVEGRPAYERLVHEARRRGLLGATVTRGVLGYGGDSLIHAAKILRLSEELPLVVEILDVPERIDAFLKDMDGFFSRGAVAVLDVAGFVARPGG